jgi:hypothetical protein
MYEAIPLPVISSGGTMLHEDTVKNRYSFEESRNLSRGREYRAFQRLPSQPLRGKCTPSAFGSSPYGKATHYDLCVASLLQIVFAATPMGEPSFNGAVWTLIFFTQISILSFYTGTHPPEGKRVTGFSVACGSLRIQFPCHRKRSPLPLKREGCGCLPRSGCRPQFSSLNSQFCNKKRDAGFPTSLLDYSVLLA